MSKQFATLCDAEEFYKIDYVISTNTQNSSSHSIPSTPAAEKQPNVMSDTQLSPIFSRTAQRKATTVTLGDTVENFIDAFKNKMTWRLKKQVLNCLFQDYVTEYGGMDFFSFVKHDFMDVSLSAMKTLFDEGKHNLLHCMSGCFQRTESQQETRMPLNRMPFGLIDYNLRFFSASSPQKLGIEEHYSSWLETMFAHFGQKWLCLFRGPFWQYDLQEIHNGNPILSMQHNNVEKTSVANQEEHSVENLSIIDSALHDSCIDLDQYTDPVFEYTDPITECIEVSCSPDVVNPVLDEAWKYPVSQRSFLWSQMSEEDRKAIEDEQISPELMEEHHNIKPPSRMKSKQKNPFLYNTMKVSYR